MVRRTVGDVRGELSQVSGSTGMSLTDDRFFARLNRAIEELMNEGDWPGVVDRWLVKQVGGAVILPGHLDRLMQVCVNGIPKELRSAWFEFIGYGPGFQQKGQSWSDVVLERGETCLQVEWPTDGGPWRMIVDGAASDGGIVVKVEGLGVGGQPVSEDFIISDSGIPVSGNVDFESVLSVIKPETRSSVGLTAFNGAKTVKLATYAPKETCPSYRSYFLPSMDNSSTSTLLARCRRRFVPVVRDTDILIISNLPALTAMVQAEWKRVAGNFEEYAVYKQTAVDLMRKEAKAYRGKTRVPSISFQGGFPIGDMPEVH